MIQAEQSEDKMKQLRQNRIFSFLTILIIYALAIWLGIIIYRMLPYAYWLNLLLADIAATVFVFVFSVLFKNASVYDPYWSVQPIAILVAFALEQKLTPVGIVLLVAVWIWGLRLTANWAYTFYSLEHQDWRYTMLKERTGVWYPVINFVGIHLVPTLIVYACTLPAVEVFVKAAPWRWQCLLFAGLPFAAILLQGTADWQLHIFRNAKREGFIREGLWKHSRHPNYLGEILMWWGVALTSVAALEGSWYLLTGAIANTLLFLFVSVPLADAHQARKPGFEEYKAETHMLWPF